MDECAHGQRYIFSVYLARDELEALATHVVDGFFSENEHRMMEVIRDDPDLLELSQHLYQKFRHMGGIPSRVKVILTDERSRLLETDFTYQLVKSRLKYDLYRQLRALPRSERRLVG